MKYRNGNANGLTVACLLVPDGPVQVETAELLDLLLQLSLGLDKTSLITCRGPQQQNASWDANHQYLWYSDRQATWKMKRNEKLSYKLILIKLHYSKI